MRVASGLLGLNSIYFEISIIQISLVMGFACCVAGAGGEGQSKVEG